MCESLRRCWFVFCLAWVGSQLAAAPPGSETQFDVPYGADPQQQLDLYLPSSRSGSLPVVVWIHGGGWREGDKRMPPNGVGDLARVLNERGFVAVSVNYRMGEEYLHPTHLDDVQRAVRWLRSHADEYRIDPERIGVAGISAGGHLAAMLAVRETRQLQQDELDAFSSRANAVVAINPPTDVRDWPAFTDSPLRAAVPTLFGSEDNATREARTDASPLCFVDRHASPTLFVVGGRDPLVDPEHSRRMAKELNRQGVDAALFVLPEGGHGLFPETVPEVCEQLIQWFEKELVVPGGERVE